MKTLPTLLMVPTMLLIIHILIIVPVALIGFYSYMFFSYNPPYLIIFKEWGDVSLFVLGTCLLTLISLVGIGLRADFYGK